MRSTNRRLQREEALTNKIVRPSQRLTTRPKSTASCPSAHSARSHSRGQTTTRAKSASVYTSREYSRINHKQ